MKELFDQYAEAVCSVYHVTSEELFTKGKRRDITDARHLLYYLCNDRGLRVMTVMRYMKDSGYDTEHRSICYGISQIAKRILSDGDLRHIANTVHSKVNFK